MKYTINKYSITGKSFFICFVLFFVHLKDLSFQCVELMFQKNVEINRKDINGNTPLSLAVSKGHDR